MGFDSAASLDEAASPTTAPVAAARSAESHRAAEPVRTEPERAEPRSDPAFAAELATLDLRVSMLLGRFDRFVRRAESDHRAWSDDTHRRMRRLAARGSSLQTTHGIAPRDVERARATLAVLARHLRRLDDARAAAAVHRAVPEAGSPQA